MHQVLNSKLLSLLFRLFLAIEPILDKVKQRCPNTDISTSHKHMLVSPFNPTPPNSPPHLSQHLQRST